MGHLVNMIMCRYFRYLANGSYVDLTFLLAWSRPERCGCWNLSIAGEEGRHLSPEDDGKEG